MATTTTAISASLKDGVDVPSEPSRPATTSMGIAAMSWNRSSPRAERPSGIRVSPRSSSRRKATAVEDSANDRPQSIAACHPIPARCRSAAPNATPSSRPQTSICIDPSTKTSLRMAHRRLGESSSPMMNSIITTPHWDTPIMVSTFVTSFRHDGPTSTPAIR
ncbi:hypothetical protein D9M68_642370 [compost metagenome]